MVYSFICSQLASNNLDYDREFLNNKQQETQILLQPIIDAFLLEGYNGFKPPCYEPQEDNCRDDNTCTSYSPWIEDYANKIMAGNGNSHLNFNLEVRDSFHRSYTVNLFSKPPVHLPQIRNFCNGGEACTLKISSVTQALYHCLEIFDTGRDRP